MSDVEVKQVICVKWGTRYGAEYVNKIYGMVKRNITPPFRVICFTDDPSGIRDEVVCHPLPELGCSIPVNVPGKWPKTALWSKDLYGVTGLVLYVDLDVVITGNLDDFFTIGKPEDVFLARNPVKPLERLGQSSVFRFQVGAHHYMLDDFRKDPQAIAEKYQFEQRYTTNCIRGGIKFWPRKWVRHYRKDCLGIWPLRYFRHPQLPDGAKVILFPSKPDPPDAIVGRRLENHPFLPRWEHLKKCFAGERKFKDFIFPAPWIKDHWRE